MTYIWDVFCIYKWICSVGKSLCNNDHIHMPTLTWVIQNENVYNTYLGQLKKCNNLTKSGVIHINIIIKDTDQT